MSITKAEYERSLSAVTVEDAHPGKTAGSITALQLGELAKTLKESRLIVPVPPDYKACIARWRQVSTAAPKPSTASLKALCERDYEALQQEALTPLIVTDWNLAEAAELGVDPSEAEVRRQLEVEMSKRFHSKGAFQKFLSSFGREAAEVRQRAKVALIRARLNEKAIPNISKLPKQELPLRLKALTEQFEYKWKARTICADGFIVPYCKDYKPPPPERAKSEKPPVVTAAPVTPPPPPSMPSTSKADQ